MLLGVDVGGTFTDAVLIDGSSVHTAKAPTTPEHETEGVMAAVRSVCERAEVEPTEVTHLAHGMTVGTNALLERRGARTALVATAGHTDLLVTARQDRLSLYDLCADRPPPLAEPELAVAVGERIGADGPVTELTDDECERVVEELSSSGAEAAALCLLFSFADDSHERKLARAIRDSVPDLQLSVSSEVLPRHREYERASTTVIDAYLAPLLSRYLGELADACEEAGLPEPVLMKSSGGVAALAEVAGSGAWSVLSGPAGGAVGAARVATSVGSERAVSFDMGGTSCDVCVVEEGGVRRTATRELAERPIQLTTVDVHTVGAGGGSIGWIDSGGALRVGPRSAGAEPGPACYGKGGNEPTVTDANLLLGRLPADAPLAGDIELDREAAAAAIGSLATELEMEPEEAAEGIIRVANQEMLRALRVVTVERGVDPREYDLVAFGGAGGLHAAELARELGSPRFVIPRAAGVLSALGLAVSERRQDQARTVMLSGGELTDERLESIIDEMASDAADSLAEVERTEVVCELRYRGQSFELDVPAARGVEVEELTEGFAEAHAERYGYRDTDAEVELVAIRVAAIGPRTEVDLDPPRASPDVGEREIRMPEGDRTAKVITGHPDADDGPLEGPCVIELTETSVVIPEGCRAEAAAGGSIVVEVGSPT
ncbi:MAG: hydantoinase/oxoprolinase family protein [Solirubrobacterales bacterium]